MVQLFGLVLVSFLITSIFLVPFINLLFHLRSKKRKQLGEALSGKQREYKFSIDSTTPIHNQLLKGKDVDTPVGGGILIIVIITILCCSILLLNKGFLNIEIIIILASLLLFGFIGFLDDLKKIFTIFSGKYQGIRGRYILILQILFSLFVSFLLYYFLGFDNIFIPLYGNIILGWLYIPLAALAIVSFANAYNISDGLDGLSSGLLVICLLAFLVLAHAVFDETLSIFIGIWVGALIAYLYFNVFPARIYLGDAGAYGFGATLAVVGLLTGKILGLAVIGGVYIIIVGSSLIQILSKKILKRKLFPVAPIHMYFKYIGWEEPKIVMRFWLAGAIFAILGLWLSLLSR